MQIATSLEPLYGPWWALPFGAMLLSIAILPLATPDFWHRAQGRIAVFWASAFLIPTAMVHGVPAAAGAMLHALLKEYTPLLILLVALYATGGGIAVRGHLHGSPGQNTLLLAVGALLASVMGTTGAAMLMVRPVIRANLARRRNAHVLVFFIFLVANAGGGLTPLGDPPLLLGLLGGVDFFWTVRHMAAPVLLLCALLLGIFHLTDRWFWSHESQAPGDRARPAQPLRVEGWRNVALLAVIAGTVLACGMWKPGIHGSLLGVSITLQDVVRDTLLICVTLVSLATTPRAARDHNHFQWAPMREVAKLFLGIFITIIPVVAMLRAGSAGPLAPLVRLTSDAAGQPVPALYFWATGVLSGLLDNAPTYLVFFNLAGGNPAQLMLHAPVLVAISSGAVFMGALSYIGNAPNFMVKAIAEHSKVRMPSFFGYMAWSCAVLLPCFVVLQLVFFP